MSVTSGFFNSLKGDRKYLATHVSELFDGIIRDGVFASIGECFVTKPSSGMTVTIGEGKAWVKRVWIKNDAPLPKTLDAPELVLDRIDCFALEANHNETVRSGNIVYIKGEPSSYPEKPKMKDDKFVKQYPICYIKVTHGVPNVVAKDIENAVGTESTPFVTGILDVISMDKLLGQWRGELDSFVQNEEEDFQAWYDSMKQHLSDVESEMDIWKEAEKAAIDEWFQTIKGQLSGDPAVSLQNQINRELIVRKLMSGFEDGKKTFSDDGLQITSISKSNTKLVKTFAPDFTTCTTVLYTDKGAEVATMKKTFSADGKNIDTELKIRQ